jgi:uncharacterized membrane protein
MPRALYFFRWGAIYTWLTGFFLLALVIYHGKVLVDPDRGMSGVTGMVISLAVIILSFVVYDLLWKSMAKNEMVGGIISFVLVGAMLFGLSQIFTGRAVWLHLGLVFGTIMAANVWMRIWPNQRKIITGIKTGPAADPAVVALAGLRSKHNTYMSVPLVLSMLSMHYPSMYGWEHGWIVLLVLTALGWGAVKFLYTKAASPSTAKF